MTMTQETLKPNLPTSEWFNGMCLLDRADGVRGRYCIGRHMDKYKRCPPPTWEFWTGEEWASAGKIYNYDAAVDERLSIANTHRVIQNFAAKDRIEDIEKTLIPEWLPISTAPKDGSELLLYQKNAGVQVSWWGWDEDNQEMGWYRFSPTHWMSLPPLPKS